MRRGCVNIYENGKYFLVSKQIFELVLNQENQPTGSALSQLKGEFTFFDIVRLVSSIKTQHEYLNTLSIHFLGNIPFY